MDFMPVMIRSVTTNVSKYIKYVVVCIVLLTFQQIYVYVTLSRNQVLNVKPDFKWQDYLDLNPDLRVNGITTKKQAIAHYLQNGKFEGRLYLRKVAPLPKLVSIKSESLKKSIKRVLVIYHINKVTYMNSWDVLFNNIRIFCSSLSTSTRQDTDPIILFSIVGGKQNPLSKAVPLQAPNVLIVNWEDTEASSLELQMRLVYHLGNEVLSGFKSVVFLNDVTRGPLSKRDNFKWLDTFSALLQISHGRSRVGLASVMTRCDDKGSPQLWTDSSPFALGGSMAFEVASQMLDPQHRSYINRDSSITEVVAELGYDMASVFHQSKLVRSVITPDHCLSPSNSTMQQYCDIKPSEALFMPWGGGEQFNRPGYVCSKLKDDMRQTLVQLRIEEPALELIVPETVQGGQMHDLYEQFDREVHRYQLSQESPRHKVETVTENSRVCFLVRTSTMHDSQDREGSLDYQEGLVGLIRCMRFVCSAAIVFITLFLALLAQTNPHWTAYFFVTDDQPFDERLQKILLGFDDKRLKYVNIDPTPRLKVCFVLWCLSLPYIFFSLPRLMLVTLPQITY